MNYDGHEALRRDMAGLANNLCDLKTTLKVLEDTYHYRYDGLAERLPWLLCRPNHLHTNSCGHHMA